MLSLRLRPTLPGALLVFSAILAAAPPATAQFDTTERPFADQTVPFVRRDNGQPLYFVTGDEIATFLEFRGQRRVTSYTIAYRASAPVNATVRFYHRDLTTRIVSTGRELEVGPLVAQFTHTGLPAGDRVLTFPLAPERQFVFGTAPDPGGVGEVTPSPYGGDGFFTVRLTAADGSAAPVAGLLVTASRTNGPILDSGSPSPDVFLYNYGTGLYNLSQPSGITVPGVSTLFERALFESDFYPLPAGATDGQSSLGLFVQATGINVTPPLQPTLPPPPSSPLPTLSAVSLSASTVRGGSALTGTVRLSGPAPTGGATVALSSSTRLIQVPASVTVPAGATTVTFPITTSRVDARTSGVVTGVYGVSRLATLTLTRR